MTLFLSYLARGASNVTALKLRRDGMFFKMLLSIAAFALLLTHSTPSAADCTFAALCLEKTAKKNTNMQEINANRKAVAYKQGEIANFNYADIKIQCSSSGLESFARQFVDHAWNVGLITAGREFALTVDIEQISKNTAAPPKPITYLIAQVKRDAAGNTTVTGSLVKSDDALEHVRQAARLDAFAIVYCWMHSRPGSS